MQLQTSMLYIFFAAHQCGAQRDENKNSGKTSMPVADFCVRLSFYMSNEILFLLT